MWRFTIFLLILWVVNPELRRLYDWQFGFSQVEFLSILPLLCSLPHLWSLTMGGGWKRLPRTVGVAAWCWISAFAYGLVLGILNGNGVPAAYAFATFVVPLLIGLWVAADEIPIQIALKRVSPALFLVTTFASVYAIAQFLLLPPWDAYWLQNVIGQGASSFGRPEPLHVRVFSVLNAPGPFGNYMALALLFAIPQLSLRRPWLLVQMPIWLIALGLSLDRSGWIMFAIGLVVYSCLCSQRLLMLGTLAVTATLVLGVTYVSPVFAGSETVVTMISDRLSTLLDLGADQSARDRENVYAEGIVEFSSAPLGRGLGVLGTAGMLGSSESTVVFDSGILARLIELGVPGGIMLAAGWFAMLGALWRPRQAHRRTNDHPNVYDLAPMAFATVIACLTLQLSGDVGGVIVVALWLFVALGVRAASPQAVSLSVLRGGLSVA